MKSFFNLNSGETTAAITLMILILLLILYRLFATHPLPKESIPDYFLELISDCKKAKRDSIHDLSSFNDTIKKGGGKPKQLEYEIVKLNLNLCDTNEIKGIPLFGSARAQKLVAYRDRLGGFHRMEQIHEIFVLQSIEIPFMEKYFYINPGEIKKIPINSISYQELKQHPYFDAYLAKQIIKYRETKGRIENIEQFREATRAYQSLIEKVTPYLDFQ